MYLPHETGRIGQGRVGLSRSSTLQLQCGEEVIDDLRRHNEEEIM